MSAVKMAAAETIERKVHYIGNWKSDVVTDNIIQHLRARSEADKGKKVKLRLTRDGLLVRKPVMFQGSSQFDSYKMDDIYFITVNHHNRMCLLCIIRDLKQKYQILAFRCASEWDAGQYVQLFKTLKARNKGGNYEMARKSDGNWTLRHNSAASAARQHLKIPNGKPAYNPAPNGDVHYTNQTLVPGAVVVAETQSVTQEEVYLKGRKQTNIGIQTHHQHQQHQQHHPEVDIDQMSEASDVSAMKDELESLSQELREIKFLLEKSTGISAEEHFKRAKEAKETNNNYENQTVTTIQEDRLPAGTARVYVSNRPPPTLVPNPAPLVDKDDDVFQGADYRSYGVQTNRSRPPNIKTSEVATVLKREFSSTNMDDRSPRVMAVPEPTRVEHKPVVTAQTNGVNGNVHPSEVVEGHTTDRNSMRVKFDPRSARTSTSQKSRSMRMSSDFMVVPSTVPKSIENTYARPTILRPNYVYERPPTLRHIHARRSRPQSVYIMSGSQPLKVQNPQVAYEAQF